MRAKVFLQSTNELNRDAEVALSLLSFKAISGDTKKIPQRKLV